MSFPLLARQLIGDHNPVKRHRIVPDAKQQSGDGLQKQACDRWKTSYVLLLGQAASIKPCEICSIHKIHCKVHFMDEMKFDWDDLRLFLAVAREGGLGPASESTGKSPPTLGRRMLALERRLGRELFERLPRGYALTGHGRELLNKVIELENKIAPLAPDDARTARQLVKISAGQWVTYLLCRKAADLIGHHPIALRFIAADHVLDIGRREAVIGIRNRRPDQNGLAGRRIGRVRFAVYAVDVEIDTWARVIGTTPSARWLETKIGKAPSIEVTNSRNALDLALAGTVRAVLPTFVGDAHAALKQVMPPIDELDHEQWLVTHDEDRFLPEVRATIARVYSVLKTAIQ